MKKILLLITALLTLNVAVQSQSIVTKGIADPKSKINTLIKAKSPSFSRTSLSMQNGSFSNWTTDSIESISGSQILFDHPEYWTPVNGLMFSLFFGIPVPITPEINFITFNTAVNIHIDTMNIGSDLATVFGTSERVSTLSGVFQFDGALGSSGFEIYATKYNPIGDSSEIVGVGSFAATVTNGEYQPFTASVEYLDESVIPDSIYVFASYIQGDIGTSLKFDDLAVTYQSTGISKALTSKLSVFPNPSSAQVYVRMKDGKAVENAEVIIHTIDGKVVLTESNYNSEKGIDISNLNAGFYILSINDGKTIYTQKINKI